MFNYTKRVGGIAGLLLDSPRDELFNVTEVVDGKRETKSFTIPVDFPPVCGVTYAMIRRNAGEETAVAWALELAMGREGFSAMSDIDIPREDFVKIIAVIVGRIQGLAMEVPGADAPKALSKPTAPRKRSSRASAR